MKVFVIPDIHLKPWIFDRVEEFLSKGEYDRIVCLGDLVDDWDQESNLELYEETFERLRSFIEKHPDMLYCYGNHDISYVWSAHESGYSEEARNTVLEGISMLKEHLPQETLGFIHRIDNVLFSHAGLLKVFVDHFLSDQQLNLDDMLIQINSFGKDEMWCNASPIWARPQDGWIDLYHKDMLQVVGHTPMEKTDYLNGLLTVDNFSTYRNGTPIGDQRFVWVDTVSKEWGFADRGDIPEELPDPKLDIRTYQRGDRVVFKIKMHDSNEEEILEGYVEIIDRHPGGYVSIDVMGERNGEKYFFKHLSLSDVIEHYETEEGYVSQL